MTDLSPEARIAAHLQEGVACLRRGDASRALLHLRPVVEDHDLAASPDLADVRSRALALLAQALIEAPVPQERDGLQVLQEAEALLDEAEALVCGAVEAVAPLRGALLDARTARLEASARAARATRLAATDIEPLLARISDPARRLDLLLHKAQAELDAGRSEQASAFAKRVLEAQSEDPRHAVMAWLTQAAAAPATAEVRVSQAYALAEGASEFNLVGTVARTAELLGVALPRLVGPQLRPASNTADDPQEA